MKMEFKKKKKNFVENVFKPKLILLTNFLNLEIKNFFIK